MIDHGTSNGCLPGTGQRECRSGTGVLPAAFTLIELLVVVAIVAILLAILLPALRLAKESAINLQCISRHKSHALALNMYADDYNNFVPTRGTVTGGVGDIDARSYWWTLYWDQVKSYYGQYGPFLTAYAVPRQLESGGEPPITRDTPGAVDSSSMCSAAPKFWDFDSVGPCWDGPDGSATSDNYPNRQGAYNHSTFFYKDDYRGLWGYRMSRIPKPTRTFIVADVKFNTFDAIYQRGSRHLWGGTRSGGYGVSFFDGHAKLYKTRNYPGVAYHSSRQNKCVLSDDMD
jgi:prepilin-type N-terminal cleavage/methylation domain-containing protein